MVLMLNVHPDRAADLLAPDLIRVAPHRPLTIHADMFGNICARLIAPGGDIRIMTDTIVSDSGLPDPVVADAQQHAVADLPHDALMFLMGSRYCETDRLSDFAWSLFGKTPEGWARVQAIVDFVHRHIKFDYMQARVTRSAADVVEERVGVCRDYAHLAVTLCRCMNIPARYCTGYLGDIGVPIDPAPMDYSAWFEVYLGGQWYTFDARHNTPRIGRIVIARGRDAADVAISTTFGWNQLKNFTVWTDEVTAAEAMPARELMVA
jgi:transglutaminase-like putative cysteine protease